MELCTSRTISNFPYHRLSPSNHTGLPWKTSLSLKQPFISRTHPGLLYCTHTSLRSTSSEETSTGQSQYVREPVVVTVEDAEPVDKNSFAEVAPKEVPEEDSGNGQVQAFEFFDKLDIKLDSEDTYSVLLLGGGALVALWIAVSVVIAVDSIPLFPKLLEVVGLGYTIWFSTRYLIFKKNREELVAKIEEIKQQVLGLNED